jgi:hypothetical protein
MGRQAGYYWYEFRDQLKRDGAGPRIAWWDVDLGCFAPADEGFDDEDVVVLHDLPLLPPGSPLR